jgi:hypothetical protein
MKLNITTWAIVGTRTFAFFNMRIGTNISRIERCSVDLRLKFRYCIWKAVLEMASRLISS